jgi:hypothetical protein
MGDRPRLNRRLSILIIVLLVWLLTAMVLNAASASGIPLSLDMQSELVANYAPGEFGSLGAFRISIVNDIFRDRGYSAEDAEHQAEVYRVAMNSPVPTATARNFSGDPPHTATPTITPTATETPTKTFPPPTRTKTQKPTKKPSATATVKVVKKPTKTPTNTPPPGDTKPPKIVSYELMKPPGSELTSCEFSVEDVKVVDPPFSSGIDEVRIKYVRPSSSGDNKPLNKEWGGFVKKPGSKWEGEFEGSIELELLNDGEEVEIWLKAKDNSGLGWVYKGPFIYEMGKDCP